MNTKSTILRTVATAALASAIAIGGFAATSSAHDDHDQPASLTGAQRQVIREATVQFRDVAAAEAAGYINTQSCAAHPELGGMGIHFVNPALIADGRVDPTKPEILVYEPTKQGLRLVAVEYFVADADQNLATDGDRPTLMGNAFEGPMPGHEPGMPIHYDLHAWVYKNNPSGELAAWNPRVKCPA